MLRWYIRFINKAFTMKAFFPFLILLVAGCTIVPPQERTQQAVAAAQAQGWVSKRMQTAHFNHVFFLPQQPKNVDILTIYIEGDGLAWLARDRVSADPTPIAPVALHMALKQPSGAAAYIARPCQFGDMKTQPECTKRWWTSHRFAPEVVASTDAVVSKLKQRFHAKKLQLVGYSGGGAVAALVAARRDDVGRIITVAGNMDVVSWAKGHGVSPLEGSLNPADFSAKLAGIQQIHLVGADDKNVPMTVAQSYAARFPAGQKPVIRSLAGFNHHCCWAEQWGSLFTTLASPPAL